MSSDKVAFHELPRCKFPFRVDAYPIASVFDLQPLWSMTVEGPGALQVPGLAETGQPVRIVLHFADGTVDRA